MSYHTTSKDNIVRHNISCNFAFGSNSLSFIFLEIFAKKYLGQPLKFGIRLTFLSITFEPMNPFCSSSNKSNLKSFKKRFIKVGSDLLELSCSQTDRQTDGRADGYFFFAFLTYLGLDRWSARAPTYRNYKLRSELMRPVYFVRV